MIFSGTAFIRKIYPGRSFSLLILLVFFAVYLIFPSGSSTTDGWNYAAEIKHAGEIFHPHHLLYNALGYILCYLPAKAGIGVLECMKTLNTVYAFLALCIVQLILRKLHKNEFSIIIATCLTGFSFSIMRYATENEAYILPLLFALTASYNFLKLILNPDQKYAFYPGLWMTISVLFHQVFIFWWLGILTGLILSKKLKPLMWYVLISLTAPLIYLIVIDSISGNLSWGNITRFISGDFGNNNAHLGITLQGLFFSAVNLIRSFIQIHGYIFYIIKANPVMMAPAIISVIFVLLALIKLPVRKKTADVPSFVTIHIVVIVLQFVFAVLASGNAKFMFMIPVLVFILLPFLFNNIEIFGIRLMAGMAIWNLAYGIIPLHFKLPEAERFLCAAVTENRNSMVIAADDQLLKSMIYYFTGNNTAGNIYKSPAVMKLKGYNISVLEFAVDSALRGGATIYTDCIGPKTVSRASILESNTNEAFFSRYKLAEMKSWESSMGRRVVNRVMAKR